MNKSLYISGIALAGLLMGSCSLDNDSPSAMEGNIVYSTPELANSAVMGIHQSISETNSYRGRFIPYFGVNSDCEIFNNYGGVSDPTTDKEASLACYSASSSNTYMNTANNAYSKMYEAIERANKGIADIEQYGDTTDASMNHLRGELITLRAMIYYDLVKAFGDVPYRFIPVTSETMYLPRTSRVTILKKIISDLDRAENMVYDVKQGYAASTERVSKAFVRGLSARCALFLAGKSYWPAGFDTDHPKEGLQYNIADSLQRVALYKYAYDKCVKLIDNYPTRLDDLSFEQNFHNLCEDVTTAGLESIYEIPFSAGRGRVLYTWGGKHTAASRYTALTKGGVNGPIPTLWYDYDPEDARRDITVLPYVWQADANGTKESLEDGTKVNVVVKGVSNLIAGGWSFGKLRFEWMNSRVTSTNDDGVNFQVMRLADVYMMAAEAANELGDSYHSEAVKYIKPVLNRAYPSGKVTDKLNAANDHNNFFNLIVDERKFEFAGEALRKTDLMRWGLLSSKMAEAKANLIAFANRQGKYANYPLKVYYNADLNADKIFQTDYLPDHPHYTETDSINFCKDKYYLYGLNSGDTDEAGKALKYENSSFVFTLNSTNAADVTKVQKYIDNYFINDPNQKMFWPIWKVFLDASNGQLSNYYGY